MDKWKIRNKEEDYYVSFSHDLIEKCLGQHSRITKKMKEVDPFAEKWMIESQCNLSHPVGKANFVLHFNYDGSVIIYNTFVSKMQGHNISDIIFLRKCLMWMGWNKLTSTPSEIDSSIDFWKRCWETGLIESDYIESKFGKR